MSEPRPERVLVLTPTNQDGEITRSILSGAGIACAICSDLQHLCEEAEVSGAGAALITEEVVTSPDLQCLTNVLRRQPPWSDLPLLILTYGGVASPGGELALQLLGNVTLMERPVRVTTLVGAMRSALAARRRGYEIREHLHELELHANALRDRDRQKDEFLAMLAHELRNPLAPIMNALEIMKARPSLEQGQRARQVLERQTRHLTRLVDDLLDISRITTGKIELRKSPLELGAVLERALEAVRPLMESRNHHLTVQLAPERQPLRADPTRLEQLFTNVLNNAAKYTDPGGEIALTSAREGQWAVVRVRDNGVGISAELLPDVFELFRQGDRSLARSEGGLGIGLTVVKKLVALHGGDVTVTSSGRSQGSEFTIRLPLELNGANELPAPDSSQPQTENGAHHRVLIVDDNKDTTETVAELLELKGNEVRTAHDGDSALAVAYEFHPDTILLDIGLPGKDGYQVARELRQNGMARANLIAVSGYGRQEDLERSREAGFDHYLVKPVEFDRLLALVQGANGLRPH